MRNDLNFLLLFSFFSKKTIPKGEEITIDYSGGSNENSNSNPLPCMCGSVNCKKTMY